MQVHRLRHLATRADHRLDNGECKSGKRKRLEPDMRSSARKLSTSTAVLVCSSLWSAWAYAQDPAATADTVVEPQRPVQTAPVTVTARAPAPAAPEPFINPKATFGVGLRAEFIIDPSRPAPEDAPVYQMNHDVRPYISGQVNDYIKFEGNLDSNGNNIRVLDAVLKFEFNDYLNFWTGHFLPPSDRANLSGPYYQNAWSSPNGVHAYANEYAGRDDGLAYWGQYDGGVVKWQLGFFGMGGAGTPDPRFAGRVTVNFFDPEPGYYNSSTYYGTKNILAVGAVLQHQPAPQGAPDRAADTLWNLDALWENTFGGVGTLDVEGAFYGFDGADQGTSFFLLGSFLFPQRIGIGQFQPLLRLQRAGWGDGDTFAGVATLPGQNASLLTVDAGLNYIISGHNALLSANLQYTSLAQDGQNDQTNTVLIFGGQIQAF